VASRYVRAGCSRVIREIGIPVPFDLDEFCRRLERNRRRPIRLVAVPAMPEHVSGLWIGTRDGDYVCHPQSVTPLYRAHIVLHEVAHMLLGHGSDGEGRRCTTDLLVPKLSSRLVRLVLGRTGYNTAEEHDAEVMASLLLERATRSDTSRRRHQDDNPRCDRSELAAPIRDQPAWYAMARLNARRPCRRFLMAGRHGDTGLPIDTFLRPAGSRRGEWLLAALRRWRRQWRCYRQLRPLWKAVRRAVPQIALTLPYGMRYHLRRRLYRRCIEIRDGELMLRPYCAPTPAQVTAAQTADADRGNHTPDIMLQASLLMRAIHAKRAGQRAQNAEASAIPMAPCTNLDLTTEVEALRHLSLALSSSELSKAGAGKRTSKARPRRNGKPAVPASPRELYAHKAPDDVAESECPPMRSDDHLR
jgi:hypothetical protein